MQRWALFASLCFVAASNGVQAQVGSRLDEIKANLARGNAEYVRAFGQGEAKGVAAVYDVNGSRLDQGGAVYRGRAAIEAELIKFINQVGPVTVKLESKDLWLVDDLAYESGRWSYTFSPKGSKTQTVGGQYVTAWKRQSDGSWKIFVDIGLPSA